MIVLLASALAYMTTASELTGAGIKLALPDTEEAAVTTPLMIIGADVGAVLVVGTGSGSSIWRGS